MPGYSRRKPAQAGSASGFRQVSGTGSVRSKSEASCELAKEILGIIGIRRFLEHNVSRCLSGCFLECGSELPLSDLECNDSRRCLAVQSTATTPSTEVFGYFRWKPAQAGSASGFRQVSGTGSVRSKSEASCELAKEILGIIGDKEIFGTQRFSLPFGLLFRVRERTPAF